MTADAEFDKYAENYERLLADALSAAGESGEHFARERVRFLSAGLARMGRPAGRVLDFGCGTGTAAPLLRAVPGAAAVVGVDPSAASLDVARRARGGAATFVRSDEFRPDASFDTAYVAAVFHHIPPAERAAAAGTLFRSLRPGGVLSLWEHNPWSPGARWVMHRCPFDTGCVMLWPAGTRRMLRAAGFEVLGTEYRFIFPRTLARLRPAEAWLRAAPLGAQYQVLCRKPGAVGNRAE